MCRLRTDQQCNAYNSAGSSSLSQHTKSSTSKSRSPCVLTLTRSRAFAPARTRPPSPTNALPRTRRATTWGLPIGVQWNLQLLIDRFDKAIRPGYGTHHAEQRATAGCDVGHVQWRARLGHVAMGDFGCRVGGDLHLPQQRNAARARLAFEE